MADITVMPTEFDNRFFSSRTEARWAIFFKEAGIEYEYETEAFSFETGRKYFPDFYLPSLDMWVEIKGKDTYNNIDSRIETRLKAEDLSRYSKKPVVILYGLPDSNYLVSLDLFHPIMDYVDDIEKKYGISGKWHSIDYGLFGKIDFYYSKNIDTSRYYSDRQADNECKVHFCLKLIGHTLACDDILSLTFVPAINILKVERWFRRDPESPLDILDSPGLTIDLTPRQYTYISRSGIGRSVGTGNARYLAVPYKKMLSAKFINGEYDNRGRPPALTGHRR